MRDIILIIIVFGSLPFCFSRPWIGALVWTWIGIMNPHRLTWGIAHGLPFAQLVGLALLVGLIFTKDRYPLPLTREVYLLFALWSTFFLSTLFAICPEYAWNQFFNVSKMLFMTVIMLLLFQDRKKLWILTWVIVLSLGFYGLKGGIFAVLTGGHYKILGPELSFIAGNTNLGLALNMILPIILYLRSEEAKPWLRHCLLAMFLLTIISILITYSRGALLGLLAVLPLLILKGRGKIIVMPLLVLSIIIAVPFLPEEWFNRMGTIQTYEEDQSAMARFSAWRVAYGLACDRPIFGGGFEPFSIEIWSRYLPQSTFDSFQGDQGTGAHNIFLQTLAEHGFVGLFLYIGLFLCIMLSLRQTIRRSKGNMSIRWIYNYARMLEVSFVGFLVSGMFLSMQYFDLFYLFVFITIILKNFVLIQKRKETDAANYGLPLLSKLQDSSSGRVSAK